MQVLALTFEEGAGNFAFDRSRVGIPFDLVGGPAHTQIIPSDLVVLDFDETNPDYLEASAAATNAYLNFIAQDFSLSSWIRIDNLAADNMLMCRGLTNTDGWFWWVTAAGVIMVRTNQGGAAQNTFTGAEIAVDTWYHVGCTRTGATINIFLNGVNVTDTQDTHVDPLTSARDLHIGIYDDEASQPFAGMMWNPSAWLSWVVPDDYWPMMYSTERVLFGV